MPASWRPGAVSRAGGMLAAMVCLLTAGTVGSPSSAAAQEAFRAPVEGGVWFAGSVPRGEFDRFVGFGYGLGAHLSIPVAPSGWFRVRLSGSNVIYGEENREVPFSRTIGRVLVDVSTKNNIGMFGVGPEFAVSTGPLRPYVNALVGGSVLFTESTVEEDEGVFDTRPIARDVNFSDFTFAVMPGGGLGIALGSGRRAPRIDLGIQYRFQGSARYLREGSIDENRDGTVTFDPVRSDTDLLLLRAGLTFSL